MSGSTVDRRRESHDWKRSLPKVAPWWVPVLLLALAGVSMAVSLLAGFEDWRWVQSVGLLGLSLIHFGARLSALRAMAASDTE